VVITGASAGGIGAQTASDIAKAQPAHLVLLARDAFKVQPVIDQITSISPSTKVGVVPVNLDDLDSVRAAATAVSKHLGEEGKIDVLINNAGIMGVKYAKTKIGIESQFATNHLGHFMLTQRLFCLLRLGGGARVVNLSSNGYLVCPFRPDDVNFDDGKAYDPLSGYGQSKTANILFTKGLAKRGVTSFALHPGLIFGTHLGDKMDLSLFATINEVAKKNTGKEFGSLDKPKSIEQGSATSITAAFDPTLASASGGYLKDCQLVEVEEYASDDMMVEKLWSLSETLAGEKFVI
jgi:NAD(P)-dependent dehydrogenase (short-subunit alcohol dehydrogenase family)